jgi:predicted nucleic acid-binding protein
MRYVLDSNVALKWVLPESDSPRAIRVRDDFLAGVHELLAPEVFLGEIGHALTRLERRRLIQPPDAARKFSDIVAALPSLEPCLPIFGRANEISSRNRHGFYDCLCVALAETVACELITSDQRLILNLGSAFPFIRSLASLP